jgi:hypothetical protein
MKRMRKRGKMKEKREKGIKRHNGKQKGKINAK